VTVPSTLFDGSITSGGGKDIRNVVEGTEDKFLKGGQAHPVQSETTNDPGFVMWQHRFVLDRR
jgi:hypothetical protein